MNMLSSFDNYLQVSGNTTTMTATVWTSSIKRATDSCDILQRQHGSYTTAQAVTATVGNLQRFNPAVLCLWRYGECLRYGLLDDYNLQNIAAGTRVQVDMLSSFDNYRRWLIAMASVPTTMTAEQA